MAIKYTLSTIIAYGNNLSMLDVYFISRLTVRLMSMWLTRSVLPFDRPAFEDSHSLDYNISGKGLIQVQVLNLKAFFQVFCALSLTWLEHCCDAFRVNTKSTVPLSLPISPFLPRVKSNLNRPRIIRVHRYFASTLPPTLDVDILKRYRMLTPHVDV